MSTKAIFALVFWSALLSLPEQLHAFEVTQVSPGVYVHFGRQEDASEQNAGDIANIGFIVGNKGVAIVDAGGSPAVGQHLKEAVEKITSLPILYVVNTHVHPDHIMGNVVFQHGGVQFVGHSALPAALLARGSFYIMNLAKTVGQDNAAGAEIIAPMMTVDDSLRLDLGGRLLVLKAWPTAHTDNDLSVWDSQSATLWTGDLLFNKRTPVVDGSLNGWLTVMDGLAQIPAKTVVPGHGPLVVQWPQGLDDQRRYLLTVQKDVRAVIARHGTIEQAVESGGQSEKGKWLLFDAYNKRNVTAAFAELEWE